MRFDGKKNRQVLKAIRMDEYAAVTTPAQSGARAVLMKRAADDAEDPSAGSSKPPAERLAKHSALVMTSSELDHQHILRIYSDEAGGSTGSSMYEIEGSDPVWHDHPWILGSDGEITIGEVLGHSHEVDREAVVAAVLSFIKVGKSDRSTPGSGPAKEKTKMALAKKSENESGAPDLQKAQERAAAILGMPAEHFAFLKTLSGDEAEAFIAAPAEQRAAVIQAAVRKAADSDPVLYKAKDGTEYRQSQALLAKFAKRDDEREEELAKNREETENARFEKRAGDELSGLPGTIQARAALLKAVQGIPDEALRGQAYLILKAKSNAISETMKKIGHSGQSSDSVFDGEPSDPDLKLEKLADAYATKHNVSLPVAFQKVLETDEGRALYKEAHPADV